VLELLGVGVEEDQVWLGVQQLEKQVVGVVDLLVSLFELRDFLLELCALQLLAPLVSEQRLQV